MLCGNPLIHFEWLLRCLQLPKEGRTGFLSFTLSHSKDRPVRESVIAIRCVGFYLARIIGSVGYLLSIYFLPHARSLATCVFHNFPRMPLLLKIIHPRTTIENYIWREGEEDKLVTCYLGFQIPIRCSTTSTRYFTTRYPLTERFIKSERIMRSGMHVSRIGKVRNARKIWLGNVNRRSHLWKPL